MCVLMNIFHLQPQHVILNGTVQGVDFLVAFRPHVRCTLAVLILSARRGCLLFSQQIWLQKLRGRLFDVSRLRAYRQRQTFFDLLWRSAICPAAKPSRKLSHRFFASGRQPHWIVVTHSKQTLIEFADRLKLESHVTSHFAGPRKLCFNFCCGISHDETESSWFKVGGLSAGLCVPACLYHLV